MNRIIKLLYQNIIDIVSRGYKFVYMQDDSHPAVHIYERDPVDASTTVWHLKAVRFKGGRLEVIIDDDLLIWSREDVADADTFDWEELTDKRFFLAQALNDIYDALNDKKEDE